MTKPKCYGKRPFPDKKGIKEWRKCENCIYIKKCSMLTLKKTFKFGEK